MHNRHWKILAVVSILMILMSGPALAFKFGKHFGNRGVKGSGDMETRVVKVDDFDEIELRGAFDVEVTFGKRQEVKITIDDNLWDILIADVDRGVGTCLGRAAVDHGRFAHRVDAAAFVDVAEYSQAMTIQANDARE